MDLKCISCSSNSFLKISWDLYLGTHVICNRCNKRFRQDSQPLSNINDLQSDVFQLTTSVLTLEKKLQQLESLVCNLIDNAQLMQSMIDCVYYAPMMPGYENAHIHFDHLRNF